MTKHASKRALEYYGQPLSWAEQGALLERIDNGGGARIREQHKDKLPIYFINWPRIAQTIAVVVNEERRRIVTVLPPHSGEVAWRIQKLFGKSPSNVRSEEGKT